MNIETIAANTLLNAPIRSAHRNHLLVLAYHGVEDPQTFGKHLAWLRRTRTSISIEQLLRHLGTGEPLPRSPFLVTFDDGRRSVLTNGLPVLCEHKVPAALFVVTGLIGTHIPYWWDEIKALSAAGATTSVSDLVGPELVRFLKTVGDDQRMAAINELRASVALTQPTPSRLSYPHLTVDELRQLDASGVSIGSHSVSHPLLDQCDEAKIHSELRDSRGVLEDWLDRSIQTLAYPNGNVSSNVVAAARRVGYKTGLLFDHRFQHQPIQDPLTISRIRVDSTAPIARLKALSSGLLPLTHRLRGLP